MYRVVLVDDEEIIVEGLKKVVDWQDFGCEVVATAYDAASGTKTIREQKPHILFTDIKMPDTDGLTMLAGLKSEFPHMQVIVLTGHRHFEYAQRAIRLGVNRLLTKPSRMDEIQEALEAAIQELKRLNIDPNASADDTDAPLEESAAEQQANSFLVRQATAFIEEHYMERLTLQDVADHCYVSQWHLSKLLNRHTQSSFYELLNTVRVKEAKRLLRDPKLKISDICEMVGYADTGHFSRVFKKMEGMSPNMYRNHAGERP